MSSCQLLTRNCMHSRTCGRFFLKFVFLVLLILLPIVAAPNRCQSDFNNRPARPLKPRTDGNRVSRDSLTSSPPRRRCCCCCHPPARPRAHTRPRTDDDESGSRLIYNNNDGNDGRMDSCLLLTPSWSRHD